MEKKKRLRNTPRSLSGGPLASNEGVAGILKSAKKTETRFLPPPSPVTEPPKSVRPMKRGLRVSTPNSSLNSRSAAASGSQKRNWYLTNLDQPHMAEFRGKGFGRKKEAKPAIPRSKRNWYLTNTDQPHMAEFRRRGYADGFVPNAEEARDAVRREIRSGLGRDQIKVHAVTNNRDEPGGMKDVPNYAASKEIKEMVNTLNNIFTEVETMRENVGKNSQETNATSESVVRHENSPLSINVSGNIEETNSHIDRRIFDAVVKAVEQLRGGVPVAPPAREERVQ